jgi:DNA mismatch repair protein MutH
MYVDVESVALNRLSAFVGQTVEAITEKLPVTLNTEAKGYPAVLARAMLGIKKMRVAEFEKADIEMKIIRLQKNGVPKEAMSFPAIDYISIIDEDWETSTLKEMFSRKFLFVVFQYDSDENLIFRGGKFWNMPYSDLDTHVKLVWKETVKRIQAGQADDLPKISYDQVCHVRPHGRDSSDTSPTPDGRQVVKKSFWLNSTYIAKQVGSLILK